MDTHRTLVGRGRGRGRGRDTHPCRRGRTVWSLLLQGGDRGRGRGSERVGVFGAGEEERLVGVGALEQLLLSLQEGGGMEAGAL